MLEKILKVFGGEEVQIGPALKTTTSKVKDTPSPLEGEARGEGYNFQDLRRELVSRKISISELLRILRQNSGDIRTRSDANELCEMRAILEHKGRRGVNGCMSELS